MLKVFLSVRFRAFGITFGNVTRSWMVPLGAEIPLPAAQLVTFNDRGVRLTVEIL